MYFVGVDLHKERIVICVVVQEDGQRRVVERKTYPCRSIQRIHAFFARLERFQVVVEATASYDWFVELVEPLAERVVLAHPGNLRVIAQSTKKTDKLDAQILAEFLALDMIPEAWRPTPRVREHRKLVRHRQYIQGRITSVKNRLRHVLARYNADVRGLFTMAGQQYLQELKLSDADRFLVAAMVEELQQHQQRLREADAKLAQFAQAGPIVEQEARAVLASMPCVGPVTIDVVLAEAGDVRRFSSQRKATAYAGLAPGIRQSDRQTKQLGITKAGSRLLRWALVETAWRLVGKTRHWGFLYDRLKKRCGAKKAIVAVARRVWCVMVSMLKSGQKYRHAAKEALAHA